jgi:hypothetical protein
VLPENLRWLRYVVLLSEEQICELTDGAAARDALEGSGRANPRALAALDAQADDLVARLNSEVRPRFSAMHLR